MSSQVVLITGGAQGIGPACVRAFLKRQFRVSVCDIRAQSERSEGSDYLFTLGDVTEPAVREHVVRRTLNEFGRIDILINCAGVGLHFYGFSDSARVGRQHVRRKSDGCCGNGSAGSAGHESPGIRGDRKYWIDWRESDSPVVDTVLCVEIRTSRSEQRALP